MKTSLTPDPREATPRDLIFEALEPRILYSASMGEAPPEEVPAVADEAPASLDTLSSVPEVAPAAPRSETVGSDSQSWRFEDDSFPTRLGDEQVEVIGSEHEHDHHPDGCSCQNCMMHALPLVIETEEAPGDGQVTWDNYDLSQTFQLHSKSDSNYTIYLDFDGHTTSGTSWNAAYTGGAPIVTDPYSIDGDSAFSDTELARIQRIWAAVSEDFIPFDVNVTTQDPGTAALIKTNASDQQYGIRVVIGDEDWYPNPAGGVAYVGSFDSGLDTPTFVFNRGENGIVEAVSHEVGHTLGLSHDGTSTDGYYGSHGSGATEWGAIMGAAYSTSITQWSQGEYSDANNQEDDLAIITTQNGFSYRADDYSGNLAGSYQLMDAGFASFTETYGIIERNTDFDYFTFWANPGSASFEIETIASYYNLDIKADLYDSTGLLLTSSNPVSDVDAHFSFDLDEAGQYFLSVTGTGKPEVSGTGYSDYGSLGSYRINGIVNPFSEAPSILSVSGTAETDGIGDDVIAYVNFNSPVILSNPGDAKILLSVGGQTVEAFHTGTTTSTQMAFTWQAIEGYSDTDGVSVIGNSLQLLNGATLRDSGGRGADLDFATTLLANQFVDGVRPTATFQPISDSRLDSLPSITVTFSETVTGVGLSDFELVRDGAVLPFVPGHTITTIQGGLSYRLSFENLTTELGDYEIRIKSSGTNIRDGGGNEIAPGASESWTLEKDWKAELSATNGFDPDGTSASVPSSVTFVVTLKDAAGRTIVNDSGAAIVYSFSTSGTASRHSDFINHGTSIRVEQGQSSGSITIGVIDDNLVEATETIIGSLDSATRGTIIGATSTAEISDQDLATVTLENMSGREDEGPLTFTATLDKAVAGIFSVRVTSNSGTALSGTDFQGISRVLNFSGNAGETQTFTVDPVNDLSVESSETFGLGLSFVSSSVVPTTSIDLTDTAIGTITNDDIAITGIVGSESSMLHRIGDELVVTLEFSEAVELRNDSGAVRATIHAFIGSAGYLLEHTGPTTGTSLTFSTAVSEDLSFASDLIYTPQVGQDSLTLYTGTELVSAMGDGRVAQITHSNQSLINDLFDTLRPEGNFGPTRIIIDPFSIPSPRATPAEPFPITFSEPVTGLTIDDFELTLDGAPVDISTGSVVLSSGDLDYELDLGDLTEPIGEYVLRFNGAGSGIKDAAGNDARPFERTVSWTKVEDFQAVLTAIDGSDEQGSGSTSETVVFVVTLMDRNGEVVINTTGEALTYDFSVPTGAFAVGSGGDIRIQLASTAELGTDFLAPDAVISVEAGESEGRLTINLINDDLVEADETIVAQISNANRGLILSGVATAAVIEEDLANVTIADAVANEADRSITFTAVLDRDVQGGFSIDAQFSGGTANGSTDYGNTTQTLSFDGTAGEAIQFTLPITDDLLEEFSETFIVSLNELDAPVVAAHSINVTDMATGTITDNDAAFAHLSVQHLTYDEPVGPVRTAIFTVELRDYRDFLLTNNKSDPIVFDLNLSGTAVEGVDYTRPVGGQISVDPGESRGVVILTLINDEFVEPDETIIGNISIPSGSMIPTGIGTDSAQTEILDSDTATLTVSDTTLNEEAGTASVEVTLDGAVEGGFTVDTRFTNRSASAGSDFDGAAQTLTFAGTVGEIQTVTIPIIDDFDLEATEVFQVYLSNFQALAGTVPESQITMFDRGEVTIVDDDTSNTAPTLAPISDLELLRSDGVVTVPLSVTDPDADILSTTVVSLDLPDISKQLLAFQLKEAHQFRAGHQDFYNAFGLEARFFLNDSSEFFAIFPDGEVRKWAGNLEASEVIGVLDSSYHADPAKLLFAEDPRLGSVDLAVVDGDLEIRPGVDFTGTFTVQVTSEDGLASDTQDFIVTVTDDRPYLIPIADQTTSRGAGALSFTLETSAPEGTTITFTAEAVGLESVEEAAHSLDQVANFKVASSDFYNLYGQGEKFFLNAADEFYAIVPNGTVYHWAGSFETSPVVATLDPSYHADLQRLIDVPAADPIAVPVIVEVEGDQLTVTPDAAFAGSFVVRVTSDDGTLLDTIEFDVRVNQIFPATASEPEPELISAATPPPARAGVSGSESEEEVASSSVEPVEEGFEMGQIHHYWPAHDDFLTKQSPDGARFYLTEDQDYYVILPDGSFYEWDETFESSRFLETLDVAFYDNPSLLSSIID